MTKYNSCKLNCNYSKKGDCKFCSHKNKCELIKPYSEKLDLIERERIQLEWENELLYSFIENLKYIEDNLSDFDNAKSVLDVVYFPKERNNISKIVDEIHDNDELIKEYIHVEKKLLN